jgi:hypothetical protein
MRVIREIEVAGRKVQVRELTVGEIRAWLKDAGAASGDVVDATLFEDFSLDDLTRMSSLDAAAMEALTPSEVAVVAAAAREVNADFFGMRGRLVQIGRQIVAGNSSG